MQTQPAQAQNGLYIFANQLPLASDSLSLSQLRMLLFKAELDYLNRRFVDAADIFNWIATLTQAQPPQSSTPPPQAPPVPLPDQSHISTDPTLKKILNARAHAMLLQMNSGLDYFGHARYYVELENYEAYAKVLSVLLAGGEVIETQYAAFSAKDSALANKIAAAKTIISQKQSEVDELNGLLLQTKKQINDLNQQVYQYQSLLVPLQSALANAEQAFKDAVKAKSGGCDLLSLIAFAAAAVSLATGVGEVIAGVAGAAGALQTISSSGHALDDLKQIFLGTDDKNLTVEVKDLRGDFDKMKQGYSQIKDTVAKIEDNTTKLGVDQQEFDKQLEAYKGLPQAQEYKSLLDSFTATAKARNQKSIELTGAFATASDLLQKIQDASDDLAKQQATISNTVNPDLDAIAAYLGRAVDDTKLQVMKALDGARRALEFYALTDVPETYVDKTVALLRATYDHWTTQIADVQNNIGRPPQPFNEDAGLALAFSRQQDSRLFSLFDTNGKIAFEFPLTHPRLAAASYMRCVRVSAYSVVIGGLPPNTVEYMDANLTQMGRSEFRNIQGKQMTFTHAPRAAGFSQNLATGKIGSKGTFNQPQSNFVDLGLCGSWLLDLTAISGDARKQVQSVEVRFSGTYLSNSL